MFVKLFRSLARGRAAGGNNGLNGYVKIYHHRSCQSTV